MLRVGIGRRLGRSSGSGAAETPPALPSGFVYLVDGDGNYLVDGDGAYLIGAA